MQIVPVSAAATPGSATHSPTAVEPSASAVRSGAAALDHAASQVGLSRSELLGHLGEKDRDVVAAVAAQSDNAGAVAAALATERYLGRLLSDLTVDSAQSVYERYARTPYPIEPAHLAGIITFLEARRNARVAIAPLPAMPPVKRVDRVV